MTKILLVDDEPDLLEVISMLLESLSFEVITATSGNLALTLWKEFKPDLIISDIRMPDGSGIDLLQKVRETDRQVPFILLTGYYANLTETDGLGVHSIMKKPVSLKELRETVCGILNK